MAVTAAAKLDARALRADFPILARPMYGKPLAYLDSSNSSQKPRQVLDAEREFYETVLRERAPGHLRARRARDRRLRGRAGEGARLRERRVARARSSSRAGATEAINLVAYAWGLDNLGPGDVVVVTELEHHSNFVPWQYVAGRTGAEFAAIRADEHGELAPRRARRDRRAAAASRSSPSAT